MTEAFSGVNKCSVKPMVHLPEYDHNVTPGSAVSSKSPVCASQSVSVGDRFTVMHVGTVGVVGTRDSA